MTTDFEKILNERLQKLPPEVALAIREFPWVEKVRRIANNNNLSAEQTDTLELETSIIILGLEAPINFPINLSKNIGISDELIVKIVKQIDEEVIKGLENFIEHGDLKEKQSEKDVSQVSPAPLDIASSDAGLPAQPVASLPMVEAGETAHDTTPEEKAWMEERVEPQEKPEPEGFGVADNSKTTEESKPNETPRNIVEEKLNNLTGSRYPAGQDPYHEPI